MPDGITAKSKALLERTFHEIHTNKPAIVKSTEKKYGATRAKKQMVAIGLNKARRLGARIKPTGKR